LHFARPQGNGSTRPRLLCIGLFDGTPAAWIIPTRQPTPTPQNYRCSGVKNGVRKKIYCRAGRKPLRPRNIFLMIDMKDMKKFYPCNALSFSALRGCLSANYPRFVSKLPPFCQQITPVLAENQGAFCQQITPVPKCSNMSNNNNTLLDKNRPRK